LYKLIAFFKYIFFICYWKITDLWKKIWHREKNRKNNNSEFIKDQRSVVVPLTMENYSSHFASLPQNATIYMSEPIFEKTMHSLPSNYVLPDPETLRSVTDIYCQPEAIQEESQLNNYQVLNQIKTALPKDYALTRPFTPKTSRASVSSNQRIGLTKTFTPNVAPELTQVSSLDGNNSSTKQEASTTPALHITPLQSKKKIIKPAEQHKDATQNRHYKFVFIK
jgi:hypothetical protein